MSALSRIKEWVTLEILEADDLNAEFNNIVDNVESGADITDTANVTAAGAAMENNATLHVNKDYSSGDEDASIDFNNSQAIFKWEYLSNMAVSNFDLNQPLQQQWTFDAAADFDNTSQTWAHLMQITLNYPNYISDIGKYTSSSPVLVYLDQNINDNTTYYPEVSGVQAFVSGLTANSKAGMYGSEFMVLKGDSCTTANTTIAVDGVIKSEVSPAGVPWWGCAFRAIAPLWTGHSPVRQHTAYHATGAIGWTYGFLYQDTDESTHLFSVNQTGEGYFAGKIVSKGSIEASPTSGNASVYADAPTGSDAYFILQENNVTKGAFTWDGTYTYISATDTLIFKTSGGATRATLNSSGNFNAAGNITADGSCCVDYVFENDYALMPLDQLRVFIEDKNHLPNITIGQNGKVDLISSVSQLLEKTEEQALYILQFHERLKVLEAG